MMVKRVDKDGYMDYCQYNGFKGANCTSSGYNTTPYGVFK